MAIKKIIEIDVDQVQALGGLDALQNSLQETEKSSASLKAELRKLKEQLATLPEGTEEYNKIAKRAGEVSDKIGDINTRIKNLGSDTKNIDAVVQGTQALSGAFSVATSASALLGDENKDLQETMMKVESAIGLTVGIQSIANALQKESALAIGLSNVATKIQIGLQVAYATVVGTTTGALKALRLALATTGIGALVVALGYLISKMTESTEVTENQEEAQKNLNKSIEESLDLYNEFAKSIEFSTKVKVLQAKISGKSEKDLQEIEKQGIKARIENLDEEKELLKRSLLNKKINAESRAKINENINKNERERLDLLRELELSNLEFEKEQVEKRRQKQKQDNEDKLKKEKEYWDKYIENLRIAYEKQLEEERSFRGTLESLKVEKREESDQSFLEWTQQYETAYTESIKREQEARQAFEDAKFNIANQGLDLLANLFGKSKGIAKGILILEQSLAIGQVITNASRSIAQATANLAAVPAVIGTVPNPLYPVQAAATAKGIATTKISAGISIANILAQTIGKLSNSSGLGGGSASGGSSGGGGASATPQFNLVGQSSTNQLTATIASQQNRPVQTYVVGSQVTSQQALDRNAQQNSVFG